MAESIRPSHTPQPKVLEFSSAMNGFEVVDRNGERIGSVRGVNLGRTCILVETGRGSLFGRKQTHGVHVCAARQFDLDTFTISLAATKEDVVEAPQFGELDPDCETALARYYYDRLVALGDKVNADG